MFPVGFLSPSYQFQWLFIQLFCLSRLFLLQPFPSWSILLGSLPDSLPFLWFHPILAGLVPVQSFRLNFFHQASRFTLPLPPPIWMWMHFVWVAAGTGDLSLSIGKMGSLLSAPVGNLTSNLKTSQKRPQTSQK